MYGGKEKLVIFDVDGTLVDAFHAVESAFARHDMAIGDEYRDYVAAIGAGMHPFIASYRFEDHGHLRDDFNVPKEVLARTPEDLAARLCHALDLDYPVVAPAVAIAG